MNWLRRSRWLRFIVARLVIAAMSMQAWQAAHALAPFPGRVNNALAEVMEMRGARMGFVPTDPRIAATIEGMGDAAAGAATDVAVGAAAGTALTWGAVALGVVVVGAGVWYLASDHKYSVNCDSLTSCALALLSGSGHPNLTVGSGFWTTQAVSGVTIRCSEPTACVETAMSELTAVNPSTYVYSTRGTPTSGTNTYTQPYQRCGTGSNSSSCITSYTLSVSKSGSTYTGPECASGAMTFSGSDATKGSCFDLTPAPVKSNPLALPDLIPGTELGKPADPALMAQVANKLWQRAANTTGYAGIPYSTTDPITAADMTKLQTQYPDVWPTVGDLDAPVAQGATSGTALSHVPLPANGTKTSTDTGYVPDPATNPGTNPSTQPLTNLGVDPGTPAPNAEANTPTAGSILDPIFNFLPTIGGATVSVPTGGACPTFDGTVFTWHLHIDKHCQLIDENKAVISACMLLAWAVLASMIVLKA